MSPSERDEIVALVTRLQEQNAELMVANEELRRQLAESHRSGRRLRSRRASASSKPKRPGRKPGMGLFSYRKPPSDEEITGPVVEVPVSADTCPGCGGSLVDEGESYCLCSKSGSWSSLKTSLLEVSNSRTSLSSPVTRWAWLASSAWSRWTSRPSESRIEPCSLGLSRYSLRLLTGIRRATGALSPGTTVYSRMTLLSLGPGVVGRPGLASQLQVNLGGVLL